MSENVLNSGQLSSEQRRAIEALIAGATKEQAATVADRTRRTLDRWLAEDDTFRQALHHASDIALEDAARRLRGLLGDVITKLDKWVVNNPGVDDAGDIMRAFDLIARHAVRLAEHQELEERVRALEEKAK